MKQVYELRKGQKPPITGLEAMYMVVSSQMTDKREHNKELERFLGDHSAPKREVGQRLMIIGSEDDDTKFINMVESLGATFVVDDHCTGSRYFWNEVVPNGGKIESIAKRYIERPACPSKDWEKRTRIPHIVKLAKDWGVQGAIVMQQKFCDPHELDTPTIIKELKKNGIPSLFLEFDVTVPIGQFRVRAEAFLEMLRQDELF